MIKIILLTALFYRILFVTFPVFLFNVFHVASEFEMNTVQGAMCSCVILL